MTTEVTTETQTFTFPVELGYLMSVPVYEGHKRGTNWFAVICRNPAAPGGIGRNFQPRGRGEFVYQIEGVPVGSPVEFGADYTSGGGNKNRRRWYGVLVGLTGTEATFEKFETSAQAIKAAAEFTR